MKCSSLIFLKKKKHAQYLLRNSNQNQNVTFILTYCPKHLTSSKTKQKRKIDNF